MMEQGDVVSCGSCRRARPIETPVVELCGTDMVVSDGDGVVTYADLV